MPILDRDPFDRLTLRRLRIAALVARGYSRTEIAALTSYSPDTVKGIVTELARLTGTSGGGMSVVRDWWHENRIQITLEFLEATGISPAELMEASRRQGSGSDQ